MDFNRYAANYKLAVNQSLPGWHLNVDIFARTKAAHLISIAKRRLGNLAGRKVLDVGCGVGMTDEFLSGHWGSVHGVDTAQKLIAIAATANPTVEYRSYDGSRLPYNDDAFDVTFAICVIHHIELAEWDHFIGEMKRVTRPGGLAIVFEHNPLNPLTRRAVRNCEFDDRAILLRMKVAIDLLERCGLPVIERRYITFIPSATRIALWTESALRTLPIGAQYYVAGSKPLL